MTDSITEIIRVPVAEIRRLQHLINSDGCIEDCGANEQLARFSADFGAGLEADIRVCNGDGGPFIDAVLYADGEEVALLEPGYELYGSYRFEYDGKEYVVVIRSDQPPDPAALDRLCYLADRLAAHMGGEVELRVLEQVDALLAAVGPVRAEVAPPATESLPLFCETLESLVVQGVVQVVGPGPSNDNVVCRLGQRCPYPSDLAFAKWQARLDWALDFLPLYNFGRLLAYGAFAAALAAIPRQNSLSYTDVCFLVWKRYDLSLGPLDLETESSRAIAAILCQKLDRPPLT